MQVLIAVLCVTVALLAYTFGTWLEFRTAALTRWVVLSFFVGLVGDITGTVLMATLVSGFSFNIHSLAGVVALSFMVIKTIWLTTRFWNGSTEVLPRAYSLFVWGLWVAVYVVGFAVHG